MADFFRRKKLEKGKAKGIITVDDNKNLQEQIKEDLQNEAKDLIEVGNESAVKAMNDGTFAQTDCKAMEEANKQVVEAELNRRGQAVRSDRDGSVVLANKKESLKDVKFYEEGDDPNYQVMAEMMSIQKDRIVKQGEKKYQLKYFNCVHDLCKLTPFQNGFLMTDCARNLLGEVYWEEFGTAKGTALRDKFHKLPQLHNAIGKKIAVLLRDGDMLEDCTEANNIGKECPKFYLPSVKHYQDQFVQVDSNKPVDKTYLNLVIESIFKEADNTLIDGKVSPQLVQVVSDLNTYFKGKLGVEMPLPSEGDNNLSQLTQIKNFIDLNTCRAKNAAERLEVNDEGQRLIKNCNQIVATFRKKAIQEYVNPNHSDFIIREWDEGFGKYTDKLLLILELNLFDKGRLTIQNLVEFLCDKILIQIGKVFGFMNRVRELSGHAEHFSATQENLVNNVFECLDIIKNPKDLLKSKTRLLQYLTTMQNTEVDSIGSRFLYKELKAIEGDYNMIQSGFACVFNVGSRVLNIVQATYTNAIKIDSEDKGTHPMTLINGLKAAYREKSELDDKMVKLMAQIAEYTVSIEQKNNFADQDSEKDIKNLDSSRKNAIYKQQKQLDEDRSASEIECADLDSRRMTVDDQNRQLQEDEEYKLMINSRTEMINNFSKQKKKNTLIQELYKEKEGLDLRLSNPGTDNYKEQFRLHEQTLVTQEKIDEVYEQRKPLIDKEQVRLRQLSAAISKETKCSSLNKNSLYKKRDDILSRRLADWDVYRELQKTKKSEMDRMHIFSSRRSTAIYYDEEIRKSRWYFENTNKSDLADVDARLLQLDKANDESDRIWESNKAERIKNVNNEISSNQANLNNSKTTISDELNKNWKIRQDELKNLSCAQNDGAKALREKLESDIEEQTKLIREKEAGLLEYNDMIAKSNESYMNQQNIRIHNLATEKKSMMLKKFEDKKNLDLQTMLNYKEKLDKRQTDIRGSKDAANKIITEYMDEVKDIKSNLAVQQDTLKLKLEEQVLLLQKNDEAKSKINGLNADILKVERKIKMPLSGQFSLKERVDVLARQIEKRVVTGSGFVTLLNEPWEIGQKNSMLSGLIMPIKGDIFWGAIEDLNDAVSEKKTFIEKIQALEITPENGDIYYSLFGTQMERLDQFHVTQAGPPLNSMRITEQLKQEPFSDQLRVNDGSEKLALKNETCSSETE